MMTVYDPKLAKIGMDRHTGKKIAIKLEHVRQTWLIFLPLR